MYTSRNLGDTAIVQEVMKQIRGRLPGCEFVGICREPEDAVRTHQIAAFASSGYGAALRADGAPWNEVEHPGPGWLERGLGTRRIAAVIRTLDLLVMSGGGQIEDFFGGPASQPRALITWTLLARAFRVPVAFFSVGVDQVLNRWSRSLSVNAVRFANLRSFRDAGSVDILRDAGLRAVCRVDPDPALGIDTRPISSRRRLRDDVIVVSPISFRTWTETREASYDAYLASLAKACDRWAAEGCRIRFVCSDVAMDPPIVELVRSQLRPMNRARCDFVDVRTPDGFLECVVDARFVVASRLHGAILSLAAGAPVIAISPARKVTRLMSDSGLADYCIEMPIMSVTDLLSAAARVESEQVALRKKIAAMTQRCRSELNQAYDELVKLLPRVPRTAE